MLGGDGMRLRVKLYKKWWDLERFGLTPAKLVRRVVNNNEPKILCVCVPKSGTHMLERALCLYPKFYRRFVRTVEDRKLRESREVANLLAALKPGQIIFSHLHFTRERLETVRQQGIRPVFMIRDPRDVAISEHLFIRNNDKHYLHELFVSEPDMESCLRMTISGHPPSNYPSIAERLAKYVGWFNKDSLVIRFEDLVGSRGGGDKERQFETLRSLFNHVGIRIEDKELEQLSSRIFSEVSPTFRKGKVGGWEIAMSDDIKELFREVAGKTLIQYGYEADENWFSERARC